MNGWTLCFVLLLPLTGCDDSEVTHVKTIGSEPDVTPLCTNGTMNIITLIICRISTERSRGEECRLTYQYGRDFEHGCDSRFTLIIENHTVFLHLTSLTAEDSGNYTCECSLPDGTFIHHLNINVKENEDASSSPEIFLLIPVITCVSCVTILIITGVILGYIHKKCCQSLPNTRQTQPPASHLNMVMYMKLFDQDDPDYLNTSLLYQTRTTSANSTVTYTQVN